METSGEGENHPFPSRRVPQRATRREKLCHLPVSELRGHGSGQARLPGERASRQAAPRGPDRPLLKACWSRRKIPPPQDSRSPEEALAAFAGHGVEVKAGGSVPADATDPGHVPVQVAGRVGKRRAGSHRLHLWGSRESQVFISWSGHSFPRSKLDANKGFFVGFKTIWRDQLPRSLRPGAPTPQKSGFWLVFSACAHSPSDTSKTSTDPPSPRHTPAHARSSLLSVSGRTPLAHPKPGSLPTPPELLHFCFQKASQGPEPTPSDAAKPQGKRSGRPPAGAEFPSRRGRKQNQHPHASSRKREKSQERVLLKKKNHPQRGRKQEREETVLLTQTAEINIKMELLIDFPWLAASTGRSLSAAGTPQQLKALAKQKGPSFSRHQIVVETTPRLRFQAAPAGQAASGAQQLPCLPPCPFHTSPDKFWADSRASNKLFGFLCRAKRSLEALQIATAFERLLAGAGIVPCKTLLIAPSAVPGAWGFLRSWFHLYLTRNPAQPTLRVPLARSPGHLRCLETAPRRRQTEPQGERPRRRAGFAFTCVGKVRHALLLHLPGALELGHGATCN